MLSCNKRSIVVVVVLYSVDGGGRLVMLPRVSRSLLLLVPVLMASGDSDVAGSK